MGGPAFSIILLVMTAAACLPLLSLPAQVGPERSVVRRVDELRPLATAMLVQQQALQAWHRANPGIYGDVTPSLTLPAPWSAVPGLVSLLGASGGEVIGVTYYDSGRYPYRAADIATALSEQTGYSGEVGITAETGLASAQGTIVPLPAGVATGVAAVAQIFR